MDYKWNISHPVHLALHDSEVTKLSPPRWRRVRTPLFWIVLLALVLRLALILIGHTYRFRTADNNFSFGWEMGRIGVALASGQGFSNPFVEPTGPTAWEPPLYPLLIAGVFKVFGIYTHLSAIVLLCLNSIFSALTCIPIFLIAKRCFGETVAVWTGWLWALLPNIAYWPTRWVWETSLAAFLLAVLFLLALTIEDRDGLKPWAQFGVLWGVAALVNTSLLAFLPASGLWAWRQRWKRGKSSLGGVVLASAIFFACITPWLVRNYRVFGQFIFIRSNFGAELRLGNGPGADGTWQEYLHPTQNAYEMRRFKRLGEVAYVNQREKEAIAFIRENYARFAVLCAKRWVYYWDGGPTSPDIAGQSRLKTPVFFLTSALGFWGLGRALRLRKSGAWLFLWLLLSYPLPYYIVYPHPRYRHPIEPELAILIVFIVSEAEVSKKRSSKQGEFAG